MNFADPPDSLSGSVTRFFHELRADVLPVDDIGLQRAIAVHYNRGARLTPVAMRELAQPWQPYRSVATWYLWRSLDPIPVEY